MSAEIIVTNRTRLAVEVVSRNATRLLIDNRIDDPETPVFAIELDHHGWERLINLLAPF